MSKAKTQPWDITQHLESKEQIEAYLEAVLEDGDSGLIAGSAGSRSGQCVSFTWLVRCSLE